MNGCTSDCTPGTIGPGMNLYYGFTITSTCLTSAGVIASPIQCFAGNSISGLLAAICPLSSKCMVGLLN